MAHTAGPEASSRTKSGEQASQSDEMQACIEVCTECQRVCLASAQKCLQMGGRHADADHVRTLLDCAEICRTSADFMIRGSEHHGITCGACAEICRACAESCETVGGPEMEACAEVCRRCADSCQRMAATGHGH